MTSGTGVMEKLIDYVAKARTTELPQEVSRKTKHHILDTLAAMISGATLKPGEMALKYAKLNEGGARDAQVVASKMVLPILPAAIVNGMLAHSDETDDSNGSAGFHPGCAILPAALGMAEREDASGQDLVRAVALGYDIGSRINKALGRDALRARSTLPFSIAGTFGAVRGCRHSCRALQAGGVPLPLLLRRPAGFGRHDLRPRHRAYRKGLHFRRHAGQKRRHRGNDGSGRLQRRLGRVSRRQ